MIPPLGNASALGVHVNASIAPLYAIATTDGHVTGKLRLLLNRKVQWKCQLRQRWIGGICWKEVIEMLKISKRRREQKARKIRHVFSSGEISDKYMARLIWSMCYLYIIFLLAGLLATTDLFSHRGPESATEDCSNYSIFMELYVLPA